MGTMKITDHTGHSTIVWNEDDVKSIRKSTKAMRDTIALGGTAFKVDAEGKGERIVAFDPTAHEILVFQPLGGG